MSSAFLCIVPVNVAIKLECGVLIRHIEIHSISMGNDINTFDHPFHQSAV